MKGLSLKGQGAYFPSPQLALPLLKNLVKNLEQPSLNGGLLLWWTYQDRKEGCRWEDVKKVVCFSTLTRANTMHGKFTKKSEETLSGSLARSLARRSPSSTVPAEAAFVQPLARGKASSLSKAYMTCLCTVDGVTVPQQTTANRKQAYQ